MASEDTGIGLDENFDLAIDNSGDVESYSDINELHKDLSGILTLYVENNAIGAVLTNNKVLEMKTEINSILLDDDRVEAVENISIRKSGTARNRIRIDIELDSIYGEFEFDV